MMLLRRRATRVLTGAMGLGLITLIAVGWHLLPHAAPSGDTFAGCRRLWSHRSLAAGTPAPQENSVHGMQRAFDRGAGGVEVDVVYEPSTGRLFAQSGEFADAGEPLQLELRIMLQAIPDGGRVWLDFWTLHRLSDTDVGAAVAALKETVERAGMTDRVFVESTDVERLRRIREAGLQTSLWIEPPPVMEGHRDHLWGVLRAARAFRTGPFSAISLDYAGYSRLVGAVFGRVPILLFTVNDSTAARRFLADSRVRVILTDSVPFRVAGCE